MTVGMKPPPLPPYDAEHAEAWMRAALEEAEAAEQANEVPVGCLVIGPQSEIAGRGRDERQRPADPMAHAEVVAIREAARRQGDWRLDGYTLVVTLEPCPMCAGLILMSRIGRVIYGAPNTKWGAASTKIALLTGDHFPHKPEVIGGVLAEPCAEILSRYFAKRRRIAE